jgi:8-oxo-dGTP pyrophosphatase MutT (NUDIX family)
MNHYTRKVCPVILRKHSDVWSILAFRHPRAGTQLIKGTLEAGERPEVGALRELAEESGIDHAVVVEKIGDLDMDEAEQRWHVFLCQPSAPLADEWDHFTTDGGGHIFHFFWQPLDQEPDETWHPVFKAGLDYIRVWRSSSFNSHEP